jgi:hypothetical protein
MTRKSKTAMPKVDRIRELRHIMWRNVPGDGVRATSSGCERCHKGTARGGGLCFSCAEVELGTLVGPGYAADYARGILDLRAVENQMDEKAAGYCWV